MTNATDGNIASIPSVGFFQLDVWAELVGYEPKTLREKIVDDNLRYLRHGSRIFMRAEWYWEDLDEMRKKGLKETLNESPRSRRGKLKH